MKLHPYLIVACTFLVLLSCGNSSENKDAAATESSQTANIDYLIVPGQRVGQITPSSTLAQLQKAYGQASVQADSIHVGEGMYEKGVKLFSGKANELLLLWKDGKATAGVDRVMILQENSPLAYC